MTHHNFYLSVERFISITGKKILYTKSYPNSNEVDTSIDKTVSEENTDLNTQPIHAYL
jgi:hypothetical protein